jgi:hypothetical protein
MLSIQLYCPPLALHPKLSHRSIKKPLGEFNRLSFDNFGKGSEKWHPLGRLFCSLSVLAVPARLTGSSTEGIAVQAARSEPEIG